MPSKKPCLAERFRLAVTTLESDMDTKISAANALRENPQFTCLRREAERILAIVHIALNRNVPPSKAVECGIDDMSEALSTRKEKARQLRPSIERLEEIVHSMQGIIRQSRRQICASVSDDK